MLDGMRFQASPAIPFRFRRISPFEGARGAGRLDSQKKAGLASRLFPPVWVLTTSSIQSIRLPETVQKAGGMRLLGFGYQYRNWLRIKGDVKFLKGGNRSWSYSTRNAR